MSSEESPARPEYPLDADTPNGLRFAALYGDLRQLAERQLRRSAGAPISPTTIPAIGNAQLACAMSMFWPGALCPSGRRVKKAMLVRMPFRPSAMRFSGTGIVAPKVAFKSGVVAAHDRFC